MLESGFKFGIFVPCHFRWLLLCMLAGGGGLGGGGDRVGGEALLIVAGSCGAAGALAEIFLWV